MTTPGADAFIRQLDEDPELLEQVRARILTRELLQLPETVAQLVAAQQETARQLDSLRTGQEQINSRLDNLTTSVQNLHGNLGNLTDTAYENHAARLAPRLLARYLRMRRTQMLQAPTADTAPFLNVLVNQSVADGRISDQQAQDLESADMIVTTTGSDRHDTYVVIEASITVDDTDIDQAHQRAAIMAHITNAPTRAAVIGKDISLATRQRVNDLGVTFMPLSQ